MIVLSKERRWRMGNEKGNNDLFLAKVIFLKC